MENDAGPVMTGITGIADSVALASDRYLKDKAELVESWSRQPGIQKAITELVELADSSPDVEKLREAKQIGQIQSQLQKLSGFDDVKFVVWNDSFRTIASWQADRADVGYPVHPSGASNLARVMAGETVLVVQE